jgi:prepilin-type N-terminal cleavage/methylation domain-containing protein
MNYFKKINNRGFTLIELLVSVAIFSIAIPTLFVFLNNSILKVKFNSELTDAFFVLQQRAEALFSKDFNNSLLTDSNSSNNGNLLFKLDANQMQNNLSQYAAAHFDHYEVITYNRHRYYIIWNIADSSSISQVTTIKQIVVIAFWIDNGNGHQVSLNSFLRDE